VALMLGALIGAGVGLGVALVVWARFGPEAAPRPVRPTPRRPCPLRRVAVSVAVGIVAAVLTGWPAAALLAGAAVFGLGPALRRRPTAALVARLEAIAAWIEALRDTLAGSAGLSQAIVATAAAPPAAIAPELRRLAARLEAYVPLEEALMAFGADLDDPSADAVVAALSLASTTRAGQLTELLATLAANTRKEVAMRERVEAGRARAYSNMRTTVYVCLGFVTGASLLLSRTFLSPYATPLGQVVLLVVGSAFGAGLWLMTRMVRPERPSRFLRRQGAERAPNDGVLA
jgi:Flp pilus assembly protein TadB